MNNFIIKNKNYDEKSVFTPENLLREARRQKKIQIDSIPEICILDPDGDILEYLIRTDNATKDISWACYHTILYRFTFNEESYGLIGNAVGASFAVLLAEQLFASGCKMLISITSAGIISQPLNNERFVLIDTTLRDEGTSYHYLPPDEISDIQPDLFDKLKPIIQNKALSICMGRSWTTDAPYRETQTSIDAAKKAGAICVEMEASALYAFAKFCNKNIICIAHLTNTMAQNDIDFEKGVENGSIDSLNIINSVVNLIK